MSYYVQDDSPPQLWGSLLPPGTVMTPELFRALFSGNLKEIERLLQPDPTVTDL